MEKFVEMLKEGSKDLLWKQFGTLTPNQVAAALVFMKKRKEKGWTGPSVSEKTPRLWRFQVKNDEIVDAQLASIVDK